MWMRARTAESSRNSAHHIFSLPLFFPPSIKRDPEREGSVRRRSERVQIGTPMTAHRLICAWPGAICRPPCPASRCKRAQRGVRYTRVWLFLTIGWLHENSFCQFVCQSAQECIARRVTRTPDRAVSISSPLTGTMTARGTPARHKKMSHLILFKGALPFQTLFFNAFFCLRIRGQSS